MNSWCSPGGRFLHPVRWQRMPCCWMPFTPTRCALCRWSGSPFSPPGSWPYSEACKADGRRRCGWSRCRCWLPTTESSSTPRGEYTAAIEVLRDAYRSASDAGYPYLMLSCRAWMGNCYSDLGRMEEMLTHYSVAERLAEALRDTGSLSALRYNVASTQLELGQPEKALPYFASLPRPGFLDLHKLAICHEQLGHREQALTAVQQAEPMASGEMEQRMLALVRYRLEHPDYLHDDTYGTQLLDCFQRLRDTYPMGFTRFHLPWVLAWYKANRQYRQACRLLEEFPVK